MSNTIDLSTRVEQRFYAVVRWFGLLLASITFVASLMAGIISVHTLSSTVDDSIRPPTLLYEDFRRNLDASLATKEKLATSADTTLQDKENKERQAKMEADYERKLKPILDKILASLTKYAAAIQVSKPSEQGVNDFVRKNMKEIHAAVNDEMAWHYVSGLEKLTADLALDGDRLAKLPTADPHRVRWDEFLMSYTDQFRSGLAEQFERIKYEHANDGLEKAKAWGILSIAGAVFLTFVIATILLVLLRIERNTRTMLAR
jgi:hypothetical protein